MSTNPILAPFLRILGPRVETVRRIEERLSSVASMLEDLHKQSRGVRREVETITAAQGQADLAREAASAANEARITTLDKAVAHLDRRVVRIHERVEQLDAHLHETDKRLTHLDETIAHVGERVGHFDQQLNTLIAGQSAANVRLAAVEDQFSRFHKRLQGVLRRYEGTREVAFLVAATQVVESQRTLLGYDRLYVLWQAARNVAALRLPAAEIGTYKGGSAFLIATALREAGSAEAPLHVFDTFSGHPASKITDADEEHSAGLFSDVDAEDVRQFLSPFETIQIHPGEFSEQVGGLPETTFSLVHVDVDTYASTTDCLHYFTPRLATGGVLVLDDFRSEKCPGVAQAVSEFEELDRSYQTWDVSTEQLVLVRR